MEEKRIPVGEKYSLSIKEAADYFSIGTKKMRRLAEDNLGDFAVYSGNRYLIIRLRRFCSRHQRYNYRSSAK